MVQLLLSKGTDLDVELLVQGPPVSEHLETPTWTPHGKRCVRGMPPAGLAAVQGHQQVLDLLLKCCDLESLHLNAVLDIVRLRPATSAGVSAMF